MYSIVLYSIAAWSGFFVMGVELLGGRLLAPYFGSSIYVWGALITVFMLALSIGYLAGGRLSIHSPSLKKLGIILILAALTVSPMLLFGTRMLDAVSCTGTALLATCWCLTTPTRSSTTTTRSTCSRRRATLTRSARSLT